MKPHLSLAHHYWQSYLKNGDIVVDATCGNGLDTLALAKLALTSETGKVYALDIQAEAIKSTKEYLKKNLPDDLFERISLIQGCHSRFPAELARNSVHLIVYNLGYLPKGNKSLTTQVETTLESIQKARNLLAPQGLISIMCYPGHEEGEREEIALKEMLKMWDSHEWNCCYHQWVNRPKSATLFLIRKEG